MGRRNETIAICYDFDGTLIRGNMQDNSFIPQCNMSKAKFWRDVKNRAKTSDMDEVLAYMFTMLEAAKSSNTPTTKAELRKYGGKLQFFEGVEDWFDLINSYTVRKPVTVQHFIVSSGIDEMIRGTKIWKKFKHIFASGFHYDNNNAAIFPTRSINYTTKVQYLFRINKGIHNSWDNKKMNKRMSIEDRAVPFPRMIYIGDGETDVPAMKMVNNQGGYSIAVYPPPKSGGPVELETK